MRIVCKIVYELYAKLYANGIQNYMRIVCTIVYESYAKLYASLLCLKAC